MFALRLTGPLDFLNETNIPTPGGKRSCLQRIGAPRPGVWQFGLGPAPPPSQV